MDKMDGMNYAPQGRPKPVVGPDDFIFSAVRLDHGHIYGMVNGLLEAGGTLKYVYDPDPKKVEDFMFGNLINDPTKRSCTFKNATEARYFKIQMTEGANRSEKAAVAEVDIF